MKNNKGVTGVDVTISIVIIIIFVSVIAQLFANIAITNKKIQRKTTATNVAIQAIETMKQMRFTDLNSSEENPMTAEKLNLLTGSQIEVPNGYELIIGIENYQNEDVVKIISAQVNYLESKKEENVRIETLVKNETIQPIEPEEPEGDKLLSVTLYSGPDKMEYYPNEAIDYTGIQLELKYEKAGSKIINGVPYVTNCSVNEDLANGERYTITVKYNDKIFTITTYKKGWYGINSGIYYYYVDNGTKLIGDHYLPVGNADDVSYKWFYFRDDGTMFEGWRNVDGKYKYYLTEGKGGGVTTAVTTKYYFDKLREKGYERGAMLTNEWGYIYNNNKFEYFYFKEDGIMYCNEWLKLNNIWYYFKASGVMCSSEWLKLNDVWYYFKESGAMCQNESVTIDGKTYNFNSSGVCTNP